MSTRLLICLTAACSGSPAHPASCPGDVTAAVVKAYPGATATACKLEHEDGRDQYEVNVVLADGRRGEAEVLPHGDLVAFEQTIDLATLPDAVKRAIATGYPGASPTKAERVEHPGKPVVFEIEIGGREITLSETGEPVGGAAGNFTTMAIALPGGGADGIGMDYIAFDPRTKSVWVPAGNTGSVDVIDTATGKVTRIEGFPTQEMERRGRKRTVGPSSVTLGDTGTVYIGNRGDFTICAIDERTLAKGKCGKLDAMPDAIAFVAATHELWVTTPRDSSIRIVDATSLAQTGRLAFDGEPEGLAIDAAHARVYTNLENKDLTLAIGASSHKTEATSKAECGEDGPHGLRFVDNESRLLVACSTEIHSVDIAHGGAITSKVTVGDGVDDLDYDAATRTIYAAGGNPGQLAVVALASDGSLALRSSTKTGEGARNAVAGDGKIYVTHSKGSELIVVTPAH